MATAVFAGSFKCCSAGDRQRHRGVALAPMVAINAGDGGIDGSRRAVPHPWEISVPWLGRHVMRRGPEPGSVCLIRELFANTLIELIALPVAMVLEGCSAGRAGTAGPLGPLERGSHRIPRGSSEQRTELGKPLLCPWLGAAPQDRVSHGATGVPMARVACGIPISFGMGSGQQQPSELAPSLCPVCGSGLLPSCPFPLSPRQVVTFFPG